MELSVKTVLIIGQDGAGKDTLAEIWHREFGFAYHSSSYFALTTFMFPILQRLFDYQYRSIDDAFRDRVNHRELWFNLISAYNRYDPLKLAKQMLMTSQGYIGMRDPREIRAAINNNLFDAIVLVDAKERKTPNPLYSFDWVEPTITIFNNGTLAQFEQAAIAAGKSIL